MLKRSSSGETYPFLRKCSTVISEFFEDYAYVIYKTEPSGSTRSLSMPTGFESRPLALDLMSLGRKWSYIYM